MPDDNIQAIKDRIDIADLISEYVKLKKAGANFQAKCPFHNETKPSFIVSPSKQIWHCFGSCDEGGDIFKFIMKIEGLEFGDALRLLADKAGIQLKKIDPRIQTEKSRLLDFNERAATYFEKCLKAKKPALDYLKKRGIKKSSIKEWRIGYAPQNSKALKQFRNRIIFPISDNSGRIIAFVGRVLDNSLPKYINSKDSLLYNKSKVLFGFDKAKESIRKKNSCILSEGNLDVILSHQIDVKNVIASSGSAISEEQLQAIGRLTKNLVLAFDSDEAGEKTTKRTLELALSKDFNIKVIALSEKDPADLVIKKLWKTEIKKAKPIIQYFFDLNFEKYNKNKLEDKKAIAQEILPWIARIFNKIEQAHWLEKLSDKLNIKEESLRQGLPSIEQEVKQQANKAKVFNSLEERLVALNFKLKRKNKLTRKYNKRKKELVLKVELEDIKDYKIELENTKKRLQNLQMKNKLEDLSKKIKQAEKKKDNKQLKKLIIQFNNAIKR